MWLFTKHGHLNLVQQGDNLLVQAQTREDLEQVVTALEAVASKHEIQMTSEGGYRFQVAAARKDVAQAVAQLVAEIDYSSLMRSMSFDFGSEPGYVLVMRPDGLQVARFNPE